MPVSTTHPQYNDSLEIWEKTRAATKGGKAVYDGDFLRRFEPEDKARQKQYKKGAYYLNITGRTLDALIGAIFRHDPESEVPTLLDYVEEDADGSGQSLTQVAKEICSNVMQTGRYGILADYPDSPEGLTRDEVQRLELRAYMGLYSAESIRNWKTTTIGGKQMLSLVVLEEHADVSLDEFDSREVIRYRVLRLNEGVYTVQIYDDEGEPITEEVAPTAGGSTLDHIPFHIIGAANNPNGVIVGARAGHFLGPNGKFTTATAPESSSLRVALQDLREEMASIGAKLVSKGGQAETAETARNNMASEMSVLDTLVGNVSEGIEAALEDMALFQGASPEQVSFKLNDDFFDESIDPQMIMAGIALVDRGITAKKDLQDFLRAKGYIDYNRTNEEIDAEADDSLGVNLGGMNG